MREERNKAASLKNITEFYSYLQIKVTIIHAHGHPLVSGSLKGFLFLPSYGRACWIVWDFLEGVRGTLGQEG